MKRQPNTTAIRIPRSVRAMTNLSAREQLLLARVSAADRGHGCRATNQELERQLGLGERQIRSTLASLRDKKLLTVRILTGNQRIIGMTAKLARRLQR